MAQPLSIEDEEWVYLISTRTAGSKLWLVNNKDLEKKILGCLARYQEVYGVMIYAFVLMGNHYHLLAQFPNKNRALFMRDFNSAVARLVGRCVKEHGRRSVWARRYAYQTLIRDKDIEHWFFYVALNPVSSGLVSSVHDYPGYNSFFDSASGFSRTYKWVDWSAYLMKVRYDPSLNPEDFTREYKLVFSKLPGIDCEYEERLRTTLRVRQAELVSERKAKGLGFLGLKGLKAQASGAMPKTTKLSTRMSYRPLILTLCQRTRKVFLRLYFSICDAHRQASIAFLSGDFTVKFPSGTYPPPSLAVA